MSQHQTPSGSKTTKPTHKDNTPSMEFLDDEILDVVPLSVIPGEAPDSNLPMDASASACPTQGNSSSIPSRSTHATSSKEDMHHTDRVIRNLVTRILNEGHSVDGVSTPLSRMYPSPEVEPHSEKDADSSRSEKDMDVEGLCSLGKTMSSKKSVASTTANASQSEKHNSANNMIDLEDDSKVDVKKRKVREVSESDEDVEEDFPDISPVKRTTVRKSPVKVVVVHLDNISFYIEDGTAKWKFVIQRRVAVERELGKDDVEVKEVMDLIKNVGLMKTVARGKCITFSPTVINKFLGRGIEGACELEATDNEVCREITARQVKEWPSKKHLPAGKLTIKYDILHKIGSANWMPTNHISTISNTIGRFIFVVGTKLKFDYGSHVEDIVMTSAVKKPASEGGLIAELKEMCKELGAGIRVATARKESLEALITSLGQGEVMFYCFDVYFSGFSGLVCWIVSQLV
ncbi:uncharacterized protein LOC127102360 [Lathyrus oleraceus]|uniref:uncharacterized protein LOC127102360 n=1 Tax=Pisum sativum TaxID=3888 RepID=UPI0021D2A61A|nr:uncharacterized protein LOC127102360 [Pisum sativum]